VTRAALGSPALTVDPARTLVAERAVLAERRAHAMAEASRFEREALAAEQIP
jgi:hypothetical protein